MIEPMHVETDVLVIGSGGAGMYAAIEAARARRQVLLADRSLIGRGGATVMAQMTVAVGARRRRRPTTGPITCTTRSPPGAGCATRRLARLLCEEGPDCIRADGRMGRRLGAPDGHIAQAMAPGHDRPRCVYVDFLNTGPAVSKTLRTVVNKTARHPQGRRSPASSISSASTARSPALSRCISRAATPSPSPPRRRSSRPAA